MSISTIDFVQSAIAEGVQLAADLSILESETTLTALQEECTKPQRAEDALQILTHSINEQLNS